jgi:hypothetical protein
MGLRHFIRYALVNKTTLQPVLAMCEGGDESPLVQSTLDELISAISSRFGIPEAIILDTLDEAELADFKIVREEIDICDLTEDEEGTLEKLHELSQPD